MFAIQQFIFYFRNVWHYRSAKYHRVSFKNARTELERQINDESDFERSELAIGNHEKGWSEAVHISRDWKLATSNVPRARNLSQAKR